MTTPETTADDWIAALEAAPRGEIVVYVDPADVVFGENVRTDASIDAPFVASVREHGLIQYPSAFLNEDMRVQIIDGQRRILAARAAELAEVPVILRRHLVAGSVAEAVREAARIAKQVVANDQREDLTTAHRLAAVEQMLNLGVTPTTAAKQLSMDVAEVKAVREVAKSSRAREAAAADQLTLSQAAALLEFEDDPDAVERLMSAAERGQFEHAAAAIREQRREEAARAAVAAEFAERGWTVLEAWPKYSEFGTYTPIRLLRTAEGEEPGEDQVTPEHWAVALEKVARYVHAETGEEIDRFEIDWRTQHDPDRDAEDGYHFAQVRVEVAWTPAYFCTDVEAAGLTSTYSGGRGEQQEQTAEEAEAAAEAERAERRRVIECNALARAATTRRREWVREKLGGRKRWTGGAVLAARVMCADAEIISGHSARELAADLLGRSAINAAAELHAAAEAVERDDRGCVVLTALAIGAVEARMQRRAAKPEQEQPSYWRTEDDPRSMARYAAVTRELTRAYLRWLESQGYVLAPVERVAIGELTPDEAIAESAAMTGGR
ncbi:ParB/RepB/Spo0J family partition protein [Nocardia farcinica]|uniref:ParB/RepB/Spo0J family partition protein n=1 Tax=Nocardia farcinica TaxID=37329 RepID=UPI0022BA0297|nr:ParB N-terminal domain-containing protein [Nocardia farcinica]MCZ9330255.1 ParB N-terminal domain-containing protein [Nocardia farcinica]